MTPPVLLTAPTPLPDPDPLGVDRVKRNAAPPLSVFFHPGPVAPASADAPGDASTFLDRDADAPRALRSWTGAPMRAIVPLPRRAGVVPPVAVALALGPRPSRPPFRDDEIEDGDGEGNVDAFSGSRYESITAAEGLSGWSFEELRVECYAQSFVARGTKPPPAVQPSLAIPPAFVPRVVPRSEF